MMWNIATPIPMRLTGLKSCSADACTLLHSHLELAALPLVLAYAATSTPPALAADLLVLAASTLNALSIVLTY